MIRGSNGESLVAIAGGMSPGMEVWNPEDGIVRMVSPDFPDQTSLFRSAKMVSIKKGTELIFYESVTDQG